ncbi:FAD-dependent monooxygenase [Streptomyces sp. NPDC005408]|uniref:NAD(P)/FAD-dependent oxidoreductase n=1 Tax=Streptomyces sp. NPDC005408 TaxID=3155341 RepID=UPI0033A87DA3
MSEPQRPDEGRAPRRAVVIGAGLAGMLAAAALGEFADEITIVERDTLPTGPEPRKHLPQAGHAHILWCGGVEAIESLLPGVTARWLAAGARRIPLPTAMVGLSPQGWYRRWTEETHYLIACSRDLLDWVVRKQVLPAPGVKVLQRTKLLALEGDSSRVTGVRVRTAEGAERVLAADLVVDCSGRGTRAPQLLGALGVEDIRVDEVDTGLVYASRLFRAPEGAGEFPIVNVQSNAREPRPGQAAVILPVEDGRWLVTLSGTRGGEPTKAADAFEAFARSVRHPVVGELISGAEPLSDVVTFGNTANRRRYFEKARGWPEGFVAVGDAVATFNPVYGHGMSVAAQGVRALRDQIRTLGITAPGLARRAQRAIAKPTGTAWDLATGLDIFYPGATGKEPSAVDRLLGRYVDRLMLTSTGNFLVVDALTDVMTLSAPITALVRPRVVLAALRGPGLPPLTGPPLTDEELHSAGKPRSEPKTELETDSADA